MMRNRTRNTKWFVRTPLSRVTILLLSGLVLASTAYSQDGLIVNSSGYVGIGTDSPARQFHVSGPNAVLRLDRPVDAATIMFVRTDSSGNVLKTFSLGTRASGPNSGEFQIADFGQSTSGASQRRMTIDNAGNVVFNGNVQAPAFVQSSSARYKQDIETIGQAGQALKNMRGVRFVWKSNGKPSLGLIAEEVAAVYPELVQEKNGAPDAVNYAALTAVLLEAFKEQQVQIEQLQERLAALEAGTTMTATDTTDLKAITAATARP